MSSSIVRASIDYAGGIIYSDKEKSLLWYLLNGIGYLTGGVLFVSGSVFYYPSYNVDADGFTTGAYLYLVGASFFLLVGIQDWWVVKDGCIKPKRYFVEGVTENKTTADGSSLVGTASDGARVVQRIRGSDIQEGNRVELSYWRRAEPGLNVIQYVIGSIQYVLGCVCYIPSLDVAAQGSYLFESGSVFFFIAAVWDIKRLAQSNLNNPSDRTYKLQNILRPELGVALNTAGGAVLFFYGAVLFLNLVTDDDLIFATNIFLVGSIMFTLSALFLCYNLFNEAKRRGLC